MEGDGGEAVGIAWLETFSFFLFFFFPQREVANASFRYATESKSSLQDCVLGVRGVHGEVEIMMY